IGTIFGNYGDFFGNSGIKISKFGKNFGDFDDKIGIIFGDYINYFGMLGTRFGKLVDNFGDIIIKTFLVDDL
ncbi:MAG: hypothetical protein ACFE9L_11475, partial [Candidatus Hodarchaeota archaeon]